MDRILRWCILALVASLCLCEENAAPWRQSELMEPSALADALKSTSPPFVICVADATSYQTRHIAQAIFAGPAEKAQGIELLKAALSVMSKQDEIVIYCGCCPLNKCPNVRPAYKLLKDLGFTHVRVLDIMTNIQTEWFRPGYPSEGGKK